MNAQFVTLSYRLSFNTPAFLGNAQQQAQWRTPPLKALLRQWWRVVKAPEVAYDHRRLKPLEQALFGAAAEQGLAERGVGQSAVRLRLAHWHEGDRTSWPCRDMSVFHPEVQKGRWVGGDLYLGYGPLAYDKNSGSTAFSVNKTTNIARTAIADKPVAKADQVLSLRLPQEHQNDIVQALQLGAWFGALGSRSRNGFGSFDLLAIDTTPSLTSLGTHLLQGICRPLADCLELDWPHAIGLTEDGKPAVWLTEPCSSWHGAMRALAQLKIDLRHKATPLLRNGEDPKADRRQLNIDRRHLLAYPVTHHGVEGWVEKKPNSQDYKTDKQGYLIQSERLSSQLRFKVTRQDNTWRGLVCHLPAGLPDTLTKLLTPADRRFVQNEQLDVWQTVHHHLDHQPNLHRLDSKA